MTIRILRSKGRSTKTWCRSVSFGTRRDNLLLPRVVYLSVRTIADAVVSFAGIDINCRTHLSLGSFSMMPSHSSPTGCLYRKRDTHPTRILRSLVSSLLGKGVSPIGSWWCQSPPTCAGRTRGICEERWTSEVLGARPNRRLGKRRNMYRTHERGHLV